MDFVQCRVQGKNLVITTNVFKRKEIFNFDKLLKLESFFDRLEPKTATMLNESNLHICKFFNIDEHSR